MAQRRMFSPDIVGSDAFMEMPVTAQCLYFHLSMRADDDGFVGNTNIVMRMVGVNVDDLKILIVKRFILQFVNGVVVVKHWRINNFIRKDRYKPTTHFEERNRLRVKENQSYTLDEMQGLPIGNVEWKSDQDVRSTIGQPNVIPVVDPGKVRLGKVRLGKVNNIGAEAPHEPTPKDEAILFFQQVEELQNGIHNGLGIFFDERVTAFGVDKRLLWKEVLKFNNYWTELNGTGKKKRWELQKTFEWKRRLNTWFGNVGMHQIQQEKKRGKGIIGVTE